MKKWISLAAGLFFFGSSQAALQADLQDLYEKISKTTNAGMIVTDPQTGQIIFERRADYLYAPASVQKLFTASAALIELGTTFHFDTQLLSNARVANHILNGDLIVKFSGDPSLKSAQLLALLDSLKQQGVQKITGKVAIDASDDNTAPYPPGWLWEDLSYGYAAPVSAVILDRNKFGVKFSPAAVGGTPQLTTSLPKGVANFDNHIRTTSAYPKSCPVMIYSEFTNNYRLVGCLDKSYGDQRRTLALRDPVALARVLIKQSLRANGIQFNGDVEIATAPANATVLATHESQTLDLIVKEMLKKSDNLTTDALLLKTGSHFYKAPGNWQDGLDALKKILGPRAGIDFNQNLINDGAGLSRYNLLSPHQLVQLLNYDYKNPILRPVLFMTLPIGGVDGTLKWRMTEADVRGRVHAKTGSMTGVTALAGYVETRDRGPVTFAIIVNGFLGKDFPYNRLQDKTCTLLANYQGSWMS